MTQPSSQPTPEQQAINLLVQLVLDRDGQLLQNLRDAKEQARNNQLPQSVGVQALEADELEAIRDGLKDAVRGLLSNQGITLTTEGSQVLRDICADFCDRVSVGVDTWSWADAERWRQVCQQVTDVASAEY